MITIQTVQPSMAPDLVFLSSTLGYKTDEAGVRERLSNIMSRKDHCAFVAILDEKTVGFIHAYKRLLIEVPIALEIGGLAVDGDAQGTGVGKALVLAVEDWAKKNGNDWIVLSSNVKRTQAHGFYEHLGYKKVKEQFGFEKFLKK